MKNFLALKLNIIYCVPTVSHGACKQVINKFLRYDCSHTKCYRNLPFQVSFFPLDLASFQSISDFVKDFSACYSKLDILVNNAGVWSPPFDSTEDNIETTMGVNYLGHFYLTKLLG